MADIQIKLIDENSGFIENIKSENNEITILAHYKPSKGYYHEFKITEAEYTKGKPVTLYDENGEKIPGKFVKRGTKVDYLGHKEINENI